MKTSACYWILCLLCGFMPSAWVRGQTTNGKPPPHLAYAYPAGAQQGTEITVSLGGQNLNDATLARFSGPGISAKIVGYERPLNQKELTDLREKIQQLQAKRSGDKKAFSADEQKILNEMQATMARRNNRQASPGLAETLTLTLTVSADAAPGSRELRLQTAAGLSNPLVFQVGTLPEISAPVMTPTTEGATRGNRGSAQQPAATPPTSLTVSLPVIVNGQILAGEIDRIRFSARQGQQLTVIAQARTLIPYLADAVPGWFQATVSLRDSRGRELAYDDDFQFRPDPVLLCTIPADGDYSVEIKDAIYRGREDFVYRVALGELPFVQSVFPLGSNRAQPTTVALTGWNLRSAAMPVDPRNAAPGLFMLSVRSGDQPSNPVRFVIDDLPEQVETEPNDTAAPAPIATPVIVNGRIDRPADRDQVSFHGRAGESIVAEIIARRLDSPLDSALTLTDAEGKQIAFNDDYDDKAEGLLTHQADSRLQVTLPRDGLYTLTVTDTQHRGGPEYGYRLAIRAPRPDYALRVTPSAVNVPLAASVPVTVFALRRDGFAGAIDLTLRDNPDGFRLSGARIPAGQDSVTLTLTAPNATRTATLHLVGQAVIDNQPVVREAVAADDTMQAFLYRHLVAARQWEAVVSGRSLPFRISNQLPLRLKPGTPVSLTLATPSLTHAIEDLKVELINPPAGVSISSCEAKTGQVTLQLLYEPVPTKPLTEGNLVVAVAGQRPGNKSKGKAAVAPLGIAPAIPFQIVSPPPPPAPIARN